MTACSHECPAVTGLVCARHYGHRDHHAARLRLADGREVRVEWTVYDNTVPPAPQPLQT